MAMEYPQVLIRFFKFLHYKTNRAGTGLGLSLSYDIIKGHEGVIPLKRRKARLNLPFNCLQPILE
jgi:nitrogen-specific signal transduction histidine kinase